MRYKKLSCTLLVIAANIAVCPGQGIGGKGPRGFTAAGIARSSLNSTSLMLFPSTGRKAIGPLPIGGFLFAAISPNGLVIYGVPVHKTIEDSYEGIIQFQIKSRQQSTVPGSMGLGNISDITFSEDSRKIFVSGHVIGPPSVRGCGAFEIDPLAGTRRTLFMFTAPACGGPISPEGTRELVAENGQLSILNLRTGTRVPLGPTSPFEFLFRRPKWSPDGRWIVAFIGTHGSLIAADDPSTHKPIRGLSETPVWSPDSRYLLVAKSEIRCWAGLYTASLQMIEVATNKSYMIKTAHCQYISANLWVSDEVVKSLDQTAGR